MKTFALALILSLGLTVPHAPARAADAGFGNVECVQNRNVALGRRSQVTVTLRQVGRDYDLRATETRPNGSTSVLASELARVTTADRVAAFKGRKTQLLVPLNDAGDSSLKIGFRTIKLTCETL